MKTSAIQTLRGCAIAAAALIAAAATHAQTQSWEYKAYPRDRQTGQYLKDKFNLATITVEEKDGKASFRMVTPGRGDPCFSRGELPAEVERNAEITIIVVRPELAGCEPFRYEIKNDGSGGVRMNWRKERWVPDGLDHGLTPKR